MTDTLTLVHDLMLGSDGSGCTCEPCELEQGPELPPNLHTLYAWLKEFVEEEVAAWLEALEPYAVATIAAHDDDGLWCWCGHSLHYPDCACDDGLTCLSRWRLERYTPPRLGQQLAAPPGWECPDTQSEHWPGRVWQEDGRTLVECGRDGSISAIYPDGTMEAE